MSFKPYTLAAFALFFGGLLIRNPNVFRGSVTFFVVQRPESL